LFFQGKKSVLIKDLEKLMKLSAKGRDFELAGKYKRELFALKHINDVALLGDKGRAFNQEQGSVFRIEAYDVAHLSGTNAVGAMVVFQDGKLDKSAYRLFNLKNTKGGDDLGGLEEILSRRFRHQEWPYPRAIVVDGGLTQKHLAEKIIKSHKLTIPVIAVTKDKSHRPKTISGEADLIDNYKKEILLLNNDAHRFAIRNHRHHRRKLFDLL